MHTDLARRLPVPRPVLPPPPDLDHRTHTHHSALFAGAFAPSAWANAAPGPSHHSDALWHTGPPDFLLPFHRYPNTPCYSLARSDSSSAVSRDSDLSPSPELPEVVCNAPLVAPIPLPYHSPTFLLYDLPDDDEDLSHPPYTHRPHKRKRARDDDHPEPQPERDAIPAPPSKRRHIARDVPHWNAASVEQWASSTASAAAAAAAATTAAPLRHPPPAFSRRNRAR